MSRVTAALLFPQNLQCALWKTIHITIMEVVKMRFAIGFLNGTIVTLFAAGMFVVGYALGDERAKKNENTEPEDATIVEE